jgi:hypothetical protein
VEGRQTVTIARLSGALILLAALLASAPAKAIDPPPGSKNFSVPRDVPNYFSNEAGAPPGSGGIVRPSGSRPAIVEAEPPRARAKVATNKRRDTRRHASARDKRRAAKLAAARAKQRATKLAAAKARKTKAAAAKSAATKQTTARAPAKAKPIEAAQGRSTPAKPKQQPARPAG